jgi:hypothetical protein
MQIRINTYEFGFNNTINYNNYDFVQEITHNFFDSVEELENYPSDKFKYLVYINKTTFNINDKNNKAYLCIKEKYNKNELKELEKYCQCYRCNLYFIKFTELIYSNLITKIIFTIPISIITYFLKILYIINPPYYYSCIKSGSDHVHRRYVIKARELKNIDTK